MADNFDNLMTASFDVYQKGTGSPDTYNQPSQTLTIKQAGIPCRQGNTRGGREFKVGKEGSLTRRLFFTRDTVAKYGFELNEHHWIKFGADYWNIENVYPVNNRDGSIHHLEVTAELVKA